MPTPSVPAPCSRRHGFLGRALLALALSGAAFAQDTASPVILNAPTFDSVHVFLTYDANPSFAINATNSPTSFDASGLPPGAILNTRTGRISYNDAAPGLYQVTLSATNAFGTGMAPLRWSVHPMIEYPIVGKSLYRTGETVTVQLQWDAAVNVTGTPQLRALGDNTFLLSYASGSGTDRLTFTYAVGPNDFSGNAVFLRALELNGGTITHASGVAASLELPPQIIGEQPAQFRIFAPPVITSSTAAAGTVGVPFSYAIVARNSPNAYSAVGLPAGLSVNASGVIAGTPTTTGTYAVTLRAWNQYVTESSAPVTLTLRIGTTPLSTGSGGPVAARITNLSVLTDISAAAPDFSAGITLAGGDSQVTKPVLVRAAGPALGTLGVGNALSDPKLEFYSGQTMMMANDDWGGATAVGAAMVEVGAFPYASSASKDAALYLPALAAGSYTVRVSGAPGASGAVIAEVYDAAATAMTAAPRLTNLSVLKRIEGGGTLTVGFTLAGSGSKTVLIRAIGPALGLAPFALAGTMSDPQLKLFDGRSVLVKSNDDWAGDAQVAAAISATGAFPVANAASKDAMLVTTISPGAYTASASSVTGAAGVVIVEIYDVP